MEQVNDIEEASVMKWGDSYCMENILPTEEESDRLEAPCMLLKNAYGASQETIIDVIESTFIEHGLPEVKVTFMYKPDEGRYHAYLVLNSSKNSDKLLKGVISVVMPKDQIVSEPANEEEQEKTVLLFEEADHLEPRDTQNPNMLYLWGLDMDMEPSEIQELFTDLVEKWAPAAYVELQYNQKGEFNNSMKIEFYCMFDCRKSIYLLNYNQIMGAVVRAAFCNEDHIIFRKPIATKGRVREIKKPQGPPRNNAKSVNPPKAKKKRSKAKKPKESKGGWTTV
tara:strand:+ start:61426 stop:62268 length:843 start_codon:yes stop_codon:yes gene_type:complete